MKATTIKIAMAVALMGLGSILPASATQVIWSATGALAVQADDSFVPAGSLVRIGFFSIDDATIAANAGNIIFLNANFTEFDSGFVGDGVLGFAGAWSLDSGQVSDPSDVFANKRITLWVLNAPTLNSATQQGIFSANLTDWIFPDDDAIIDITAIDLSQVDILIVGSKGPTVLIPEVGEEFPTYRLAIIPEPTTGILVGFALIGAGFLRRRLA